MIYDGECGFCTESAKWCEARLGDRGTIRASQTYSDAELADLGLSRADVDRAAWWVNPPHRPLEGNEAIAACLMAIGGPYALGGRLIDLPGVQSAAGLAYRWVATNRPAVSQIARRIARLTRR